MVTHSREIGGADWAEETATVLTFMSGTVTDTQDCPTKAEAIEAVH